MEEGKTITPYGNNGTITIEEYKRDKDAKIPLPYNYLKIVDRTQLLALEKEREALDRTDIKQVTMDTDEQTQLVNQLMSNYDDKEEILQTIEEKYGTDKANQIGTIARSIFADTKIYELKNKAYLRQAGNYLYSEDNYKEDVLFLFNKATIKDVLLLTPFNPSSEDGKILRVDILVGYMNIADEGTEEARRYIIRCDKGDYGIKPGKYGTYVNKLHIISRSLQEEYTDKLLSKYPDLLDLTLAQARKKYLTYPALKNDIKQLTRNQISSSNPDSYTFNRTEEAGLLYQASFDEDLFKPDNEGQFTYVANYGNNLVYKLGWKYNFHDNNNKHLLQSYDFNLMNWIYTFIIQDLHDEKFNPNGFINGYFSNGAFILENASFSVNSILKKMGYSNPDKNARKLFWEACARLNNTWGQIEGTELKEVIGIEVTTLEGNFLSYNRGYSKNNNGKEYDVITILQVPILNKWAELLNRLSTIELKAFNVPRLQHSIKNDSIRLDLARQIDRIKFKYNGKELKEDYNLRINVDNVYKRLNLHQDTLADNPNIKRDKENTSKVIEKILTYWTTCYNTKLLIFSYEKAYNNKEELSFIVYPTPKEYLHFVCGMKYEDYEVIEKKATSNTFTDYLVKKYKIKKDTANHIKEFIEKTPAK